MNLDPDEKSNYKNNLLFLCLEWKLCINLRIIKKPDQPVKMNKTATLRQHLHPGTWNRLSRLYPRHLYRLSRLYQIPAINMEKLSLTTKNIRLESDVYGSN